jgi:enoyl-CoA hydratase/carnithine racemase
MTQSLAANEFTSIALEGARGRTTLWLDRPDKLNALSSTLVKEFGRAVDALEGDTDIGVVVVRGRGRAFSAGGDLEEFARLFRDPKAIRGFCDDFFHALTAIEASRKIYVAAVNGVCLAGGLEIMLACDLALAAASARIGDGHLGFGQLPGAGGSQRLPRAIGLRRAKRLMLAGELLTAAEAERIGLVNAVHPDAEFDAAIADCCDALCAKTASGLAAAKRMLNSVGFGDLQDGLRREIDIYVDYVTGDLDASEGLAAFKEKRPPRYRGAGPR